jgi:hypothetical protein
MSTQLPESDTVQARLTRAFKTGIVEETFGFESFQTLKRILKRERLEEFVELYFSLLEVRGTESFFTFFLEFLAVELEGQVTVCRNDSEQGVFDYGQLSTPHGVQENPTSSLSESRTVFCFLMGRQTNLQHDSILSLLKAETPVGVIVKVAPYDRNSLRGLTDFTDIEADKTASHCFLAVGDIL